MATRTDLFGVLFKELQIEEGFNVRYDYGDIQELANSILENGIQNPIHAYQKKGEINRYNLIEGHRRYKAVELLIKQKKINPEEFRIPMVKAKAMSDENRTLGLVTFNTGKPLTLLEESIVYERGQNFGMTPAEMAKKVGKSSTHISNCLLLITANLATRKMIIEGTVAATLVIDLLKSKTPKEVEEQLKAKKEEKTEQAAPEIPVVRKSNTASEDVPSKQDNTKTTGKDTKTLPEKKASRPVKITKKDLEGDKPKEVSYSRAQILTILDAFKDECKGYADRQVPIDIDIELWVQQNVD